VLEIYFWRVSLRGVEEVPVGEGELKLFEGRVLVRKKVCQWKLAVVVELKVLFLAGERVLAVLTHYLRI